MTHPAERRIARVAVDVEWLQDRLPKALGALAALTPDGLSGGVEGRSAGASDPTAQAYIGGEHYRSAYLRIDSLAAEFAGLCAQLVAEVESVRDLGVDTELEWQRHRCTGGTGDWADPTCTRIAVRNVNVGGGLQLPLCWACLKRRQRWEDKRTG